jgi:hypothetical protein
MSDSTVRALLDKLPWISNTLSTAGRTSGAALTEFLLPGQGIESHVSVLSWLLRECHTFKGSEPF